MPWEANERAPRGNTPTGLAIAKYWSEHEPSFGIDWGEPSCFACGWYDSTRPTVPQVTMIQAWDKSRLQKAHLVPHALGGSVDVSNLVMLCEECHLDAPDWAAPEFMLDWMRRRPSWMDRWAAQFSDPEVFTRLAKLGDAEEVREMIYDALDQMGNTHGTKLVISTIDAACHFVADREGV
jgi:hypothetical protein